MAKLIKISIPCALILILIAGCVDADADTQTGSSNEQISQEEEEEVPENRNLLTPDDYNKEQARDNGYTVIHEDTSTSKDDSRCGIGGGRYSTGTGTLCTYYTDEDDWYSKPEAEQTNCPPGFTRVDQAGIGRADLAGSTRQCRSTQKIATTTQNAHFYCPHGPNLVGHRSGRNAQIYGVCRLKCDPDTRHLYVSECRTNTGTDTSNSRPSSVVSTTTTTTITASKATEDTYGAFLSNDIPITTPQPSDGLPPLDGILPEFPSTPIQSAPNDDGLHIVGIETWFWIEPSNWTTQIRISDHNDKTYTTTATPASLNIIISGPINKRIDCGTSSGEIWSSQDNPSACSYSWEKAGIYEAKTEIHWNVDWVCMPNCESGNIDNITSQSLGSPFRITEVQALLQSP